MSTKHLVIAGFAIGGLLGLTTGVAVGGDAYNGWWIFGLIGAFVGKLVARIDEQRAEQDQPVAGNAGAEHRSEKTSFVRAAVAILGTVWDAYVALLVHVGLGDFIDRQPLVLGMPFLIAGLAFPPALALGLITWGGASLCGLDPNRQYRTVKA